MSKVKEVLMGPRPTINEGSLRIVDRVDQKLYIYGGVRWGKNKDLKSPTRRPTSDFFCLSLVSLKWRNDTISMRIDPSRRSPFSNRVPESPAEDFNDLTLPRLGSLPALRRPIGALVHDRSPSKTTYLFILGDCTDPGREHPVLLSINLTQNTWREIRLSGSRNMGYGRAKAQMVVIGKPDSSNIYLCVFGGEDDKGETGFDTYAVASLVEEKWTVIDCEVPPEVKLLGADPGLAVIWDVKTGREKVLILRGRQDGVVPEFNNAFIFDPETDTFRTVRPGNSSPMPPPAFSHALQHASGNPVCESLNTFFYVAWGSLLSPDSPIVTHNLRLWKAELSLPEEESDVRMGSGNMDPFNSSVSCAPGRNSHSAASPAAQNVPSSILSQRAKRSRPHALKQSPMVINWNDITAGRVKAMLDGLDRSFRVEVACLLGTLPVSSYGSELTDDGLLNGHESPRLVLVGYYPDFAGEIMGKIYNAYAYVPLKSLLEPEYEDGVDENFLDETSSIFEESAPFAIEEREATVTTIASPTPSPTASTLRFSTFTAEDLDFAYLASERGESQDFLLSPNATAAEHSTVTMNFQPDLDILPFEMEYPFLEYDMQDLMEGRDVHFTPRPDTFPSESDFEFSY
ncbi:hypothetical protein M0805_009530 [Coniferiporia weirii]|nr:hypothetical protein M0805_009530 [Coniferiporia weirii]